MFAETRSIKWEYEDRLDINLTEDMYAVSEIIDGVRMYPYVEVGFGRYFLEN